MNLLSMIDIHRINNNSKTHTQDCFQANQFKMKERSNIKTKIIMLIKIFNKHNIQVNKQISHL